MNAITIKKTSAIGKSSTTRRPYDPTDNKGRGYKFLWAIYPDFWKEKWGEKPILGYVRADSEFHAKYAAYDKGLLPVNFTFGPAPVKATPKNKTTK